MGRATDSAYLRGWVTSGVAEVIAKLGGDPAEYERRFQLSLRPSDQGIELLPAAPFVRLMEAVADELDCPDFGIRVGQAQGDAALGPVMVVASQCETVRDAYESGLRYLNNLLSALRIDLVDTPDGPRTAYRLRIPGVGPTRQIEQWTLAIPTRILPILAGPAARLRCVYFSHDRLLPQEYYDSTFGCPVHFGEVGYGVDYHATDMARTIPNNNPRLLALVSDYLDEIIASSGLSLEQQVRALIRELLPTRSCTLEVIAAHHHVSVRTMQRRLASEGLVFERLVDDVRRERAVEYLADPDMTIARISYLVGYVEQSSFSHAFRRWTGTSPRAWRQTYLAEA